MNQFKDKDILVLGLARSGLSVSKLLVELGANIIVNDAKNLQDNPEAKELLDMGIEVITGYHPDDLVTREMDFVVKNPGIPYSNSIVRQAMAMEVPVITEVEVAASLIESTMIGVTGTNGKTTTVSLLSDLLSANRSQGQCYTVGNIGVPVSEVALEAAPEDDVLLELSSFQLIASRDFHPHIAVITNIYSAHLDYHKDRDEYVRAKMNITANQTEEDYLVFYADQEELANLVNTHSKAQLVPYSLERPVPKGAYYEDGKIYYDGQELMKTEDIQLSGLHNLQNILAAVCVAKLKGYANDQIKEVVNNFAGVPHRSQVVRRFNGRTFVNDSKATNTLATQKALEGFDQDLVLIAGGLDRKEAFDALDDYLDHVQAVVTFGQTNEKLAQYFTSQGISQVRCLETVQEAVQEAYRLSQPGFVILFSPACASWDQYQSFEDRGDDFVGAIDQLMADQDTKE